MVPRERLRPIITIVTATGLEARAAWKAVGARVRVVQAGIGLSKQRSFEGDAISCGVAGGLRAGIRTGTVLIPKSVLRPDGTALECDPELRESLLRAAHALNYDPEEAPLLTSATLVHGKDRAAFAARGYAGVDMETGLISADRIACVRVVLDTPEREISPAWQNPASVIFHPFAWGNLPFLAREGPRCASIAASIVAMSI